MISNLNYFIESKENIYPPTHDGSYYLKLKFVFKELRNPVCTNRNSMFCFRFKKHFNALLYLHGSIYPLDISKGNISEVSVIELNNLIDFSLFSNHIKTKTFTYTSQ